MLDLELLWEVEALFHAAAIVLWAQPQAAGHPELEAEGVLGSYGPGEAGVGSDLDLRLILRQCDLSIWERLRPWDTASLPLATDPLVYGRQEWQTLLSWNPRLAVTLAREVHWLIPPA